MALKLTSRLRTKQEQLCVRLRKSLEKPPPAVNLRPEHLEPAGPRDAQRMLSVIIATHDSERALVPTLGRARSGRDRRSHQRSACRRRRLARRYRDRRRYRRLQFHVLEGPLGRRLQGGSGSGARALAAVSAARHDPRGRLDRRSERFVEQAAPDPRAPYSGAVPAQPSLREALSLIVAARSEPDRVPNRGS